MAKRAGLVLVIFLASSAAGWAIIFDFGLVSVLHEPAADEHGDQDELKALVANGQAAEAFAEAFHRGDELFETPFNIIDGGGANVGKGQRFTRTPRADLNGPGEWANHVPARATGPNAQSCIHCHNKPVADAAGEITGNVHRDPLHSGSLGSFIQRNTPQVFALGALQRLAEEMTETLHGIRQKAGEDACASGKPVTVDLAAKGVKFGRLTAIPSDDHVGPCEVTWNTSKVTGVSPDLVVRPYQWKGSVAFLRDFNRGAAHNELGVQGVELVGDGVDGDGDGVANELTIGDLTSLAVYLAAQPRPTSRLELASLKLIPPLSAEEKAAITRGNDVFGLVRCNTCHVRVLKIKDPIFREPSQNPNYRDGTFPAGQDPVAMGVDPAFSVTFDLTLDQPDNQIKDANGNVTFRLGSLKKDADGRAIVRLFGDLKRHNMGAGLAESIDEVGTGASSFMTENLWGVGSTAPYLHDGRATTLTEAILEHGGEAAKSRAAFKALSTDDQKALLAYLNNLVLFKL
jgi:hypothetical protein